MKAARVLRFGPPNVIINDDLPRPEPAAGQLLVRVKAAGVGNWDALIREGKVELQPLPLYSRFRAIRNRRSNRRGSFGIQARRRSIRGNKRAIHWGLRRICAAFGQNDGAKTKDPELHRGGLGSNCNYYGLADALRLCPRNRRTDRTYPWGRRQRWRLRRTTGQPGWPSCSRDRCLRRYGLRPRSWC